MRPPRRLAPAIAVVLLGLPFGAGVAVGAGTLPLYHVEVIAPDAVATAVNEGGDVVGWQTVNGTPRAFVYRSGSLALLPVPADRPLSVARDINDKGVVVGYAYKTTIDEPGDAMRWTPANGGWTITDIGFLTGDLVSEAKGINEAGQIIGHSNARSSLNEYGFLYTDATGMTVLSVPSDNFVPHDINEQGVVVGTGNYTAQRVATATGAATDLGTLAPYMFSYAHAINDGGQIAGALTTGSGNSQVVARYADATGWQVLGGLGETNLGWGINKAGTVVGEGWPRTGTAPYKRAVIYLDTAGSLLYVDDLVEAGTDWSVFGAYDINDAGQIVGWGRNRITGQRAAVRVTPVGTVAVPLAPTGLTATPHAALTVQDQNRIDLRWVDNATNETSYEIDRRQLDASGSPLTAFARIGTVSANVTTYPDPALALGAWYEYWVRAIGTAGASTYSNGAIAQAPATTPDATVPTVKITSPAAGATVSGTINVTFRATDNVAVTRVELIVDNVLVGCVAATPPTFTCRWDTRQFSNGGWTLYARAWDRAGNLGVDAITVTGNNKRKH
jgi:probable HAF family extracellular repeat protein